MVLLVYFVHKSTVFLWLNTAATINLVTDMMRRLFEGGVYPMSVFRRVVKMADGVYEYTIDCVIRGYHVYKATWVPSIGNILQCEHERGNVEDMFAVAVKRFDSETVGHIPRRISRICWFFLQQGGSIEASLSRRPRFSHTRNV